MLTRYTQETGKNRLKKEHDRARKDLIYNPLWISIADNDGKGGIAIDLDPGKQGSLRQILGLYENETVVFADSATTFLGHALDEIRPGARTWDTATGQWSDPKNLSRLATAS